MFIVVLGCSLHMGLKTWVSPMYEWHVNLIKIINIVKTESPLWYNTLVTKIGYSDYPNYCMLLFEAMQHAIRSYLSVHFLLMDVQ